MGDAATGFIQTRQLGPGDVAQLRALTALFGRAFDDPAAHGDEPPSDEYLEGWLGRDHVITLVATVEDQLVGGLVAYVLEKFERERSEVYIYDLAVAEEHRRRGVATALIAHLRDACPARGAWVIFVQADYGDDPAIALYEKLGVREEVLHYDIAVRTLPGPRGQE